jgi:hypothetical protein
MKRLARVQVTNSLGILAQPAVAGLPEAEEAFDDQKRVFALGAHLRFVAVAGLLFLRKRMPRLPFPWVKSLAFGAAARIASVWPAPGPRPSRH